MIPEGTDDEYYMGTLKMPPKQNTPPKKVTVPTKKEFKQAGGMLGQMYKKKGGRGS